jgi:signal transduction histidine kinase
VGEIASTETTGTSRSVTEKARYFVSLTATAGLAVTLVLNVAPQPAYENRSLHVSLSTAAALVLLFVAALLVGRFRRRLALLDLLALTGVVVLAVSNLFFSVLTAVLAESPGGFSTWATAGAGLLGAALLASAALAPPRLLLRPREAMIVTATITVLALGLLAALAGLFAGALPQGTFDNPPRGEWLSLVSQQQPQLLAIEILTAVCWAVASVAFARRAEREHDEFQAWLAIASTIATMAFINYSMFPSRYTELLYAGDFFLLGAIVVLVIGAIREIGSYQAAFAHAAMLEERRRVARDLHDGVAQELAFIASQMHWLPRRPEEHESTGMVMESVQRALDESRGAISALSRPVQEPLHVALAHTAQEVAGRLGARLELDLDPRVRVPAAWEEALPRVLREAVANAIRHGEAGTVTVHLRDADGIWLRITDNGKGFDVSEPRSSESFGVTSMRERAEGLGGEFKLSSEPGRGTSVEILLP